MSAHNFDHEDDESFEFPEFPELRGTRLDEFVPDYDSRPFNRIIWHSFDMSERAALRDKFNQGVS